MKTLFFVLFFIIMVASPLNAQSTLALQEKCAEGAKKVFNRWGWKEGISSYESHYNKKLDKCFIHAYSTTYKDNQVHIYETVGDVFGNKEYALYSALFEKKQDSPFKGIAPQKEDTYVLANRSCILGDKQFNSINGMEFNKQTKSWENPKIIELYQDPIKKKFDDWVKPYMEE